MIDGTAETEIQMQTRVIEKDIEREKFVYQIDMSSTFSIKLTHVLFFFVISLKRGSHKFLKTFVFLPIGKYKDYIRNNQLSFTVIPIISFPVNNFKEEVGLACHLKKG